MTDFRKRVDRVLNHCTKEFGEEVKFFPRVGGVYTVRGIFDNEFVTVDPETEQVISGNEPVLGVNLNDITFEINNGDQVQIRKTRYFIYDKQEDGQGGARLFLKRTNANEQTYDTRGR